MEEDGTCLLALKAVKSATGGEPMATVSEHQAWKARHLALRQSTAEQFPVHAAGVPALALLSESLGGFHARSPDEDAVDPDSDEEGPNAGVNSDDPFAAGYKGWRSTPPPVHEVENISIGEMNYLDSPTITSNTTEMEKFIMQQQGSSQACHAKLLEVRRTLDGILAKVNTLSDIVEAHDAIIDGNTQLIEDSVSTKNKNEKEYVDALQNCHKLYGLELLKLEGYRNEIKELEEIANPDVRSSIVFDINYTAETLAHEQQIHTQAKREADREKEYQAAAQAAADAAANNGSATNADLANAAADAAHAAGALVQTGSSTAPNVALLSTEQCHKLVSHLALKFQTGTRHGEGAEARELHEALHAAHRITRAGAVDRKPYADDAATKTACDGARTELQQTFTNAWFALNKLLEDGIALAKQKKEECELGADDEHDERQENLDNTIEDSTVNVKGATMAIRQLQGLLENGKKEVKLLNDHIALLKKDCVVEDGVTEQLVAVRNLIQSLEDCPGANSFKLSVPSDSARGGWEDAQAIHDVSDAGSSLEARRAAEAAR